MFQVHFNSYKRFRRLSKAALTVLKLCNILNKVELVQLKQKV